MLEKERTYEVDAGFRLPDLADCVPDGGRLIERPPVKLRATYYDSDDLRLARSGAWIRYRRGDDDPWTAKLPITTPGVCDEVRMAGPATAVPQRLLDLVTAYTRGKPLAPVTTLHTVRLAYQLCDREDRVAVEVVDDTVSVQEARRSVTKFRELQIERKAGKAKLLDRVEIAVRDAGAIAGGYTPSYVRALGPTALEPPPWPDPPTRLPKKATAGDVISGAIQRCVDRIVTHDPLVRLRASIGKGDTAVHQMRVGCRQLRSDLRTFDAVLEHDWASVLRDELSWLAHALGAARDAEVLRARLRHTADSDPLAPLDETAVVRIDADLAVRHEDALQSLEKALCEDRYHRLLDALLDAATNPRLNRRAAEPADDVLPTLVGKPWRRFAFGGHGQVGAAALEPSSPDESWHAVRVNGKRARYAIEAVAGVLGGEAAVLAGLLGKVQDLLGEHQDAAVAAETWVSIANADPDDHALAVTAGRLYERERTAVRAARTSFPTAWRAASKRRLTEWMS